jgi:hypothetical protein
MTGRKKVSRKGAKKNKRRKEMNFRFAPSVRLGAFA